MTIFVDTSVIMYAGGADHPLREPCREVMRRVVSGELPGVTSTEVVQEILHRFARGRREAGARMAQATIDLFGELIGIDHATMAETVRHYSQVPGISSRDAIHAGTCAVHAIGQIVSTDMGFDEVVNLERLDPRELAAN